MKKKIILYIIKKNNKEIYSMIRECKEMYYGTEDKYIIDCCDEYEEEYDIIRAVEEVADLFNGIPEVTLKIQVLYECIKDYRRSVFWALVACYLGNYFGTEAIKRLMVKL